MIKCGVAMFFLTLLGVSAICAAEKMYETHNCNTYKYKDDYEGWKRDLWVPGIEIARQMGGEKAVEAYKKSHGLK